MSVTPRIHRFSRPWSDPELTLLRRLLPPSPSVPDDDALSNALATAGYSRTAKAVRTRVENYEDRSQPTS